MRLMTQQNHASRKKKKARRYLLWRLHGTHNFCFYFLPPLPPTNYCPCFYSVLTQFSRIIHRPLLRNCFLPIKLRRVTTSCGSLALASRTRAFIWRGDAVQSRLWGCLVFFAALRPRRRAAAAAAARPPECFLCKRRRTGTLFSSRLQSLTGKPATLRTAAMNASLLPRLRRPGRLQRQIRQRERR